MRTTRKVVLLCVATMAVIGMVVSAASAVEVVGESDGAECTSKTCKVEGHDFGGAEFHDVFNIFHGVCDIEGEGDATHAGVATASLVPITNCVGDQFQPCGTWSLSLTSATTADGQFCVTINGGSTQYNCSLSGLVVSSSGHNYTVSDGSAGEQACSNGSQYVDVTLALEYDAAHATIEIR
jgi:hypothetical protein